MTEIFTSGFEDLGPDLEFHTYGRTVTESDLTAFAGLTGDHHPLHTDAEWASNSQFGSRVAHGMLLLSYSVGLAPIDPERVVALRGFERVVFKKPVHIGDTIHLAGKVLETKDLGDQTGLVKLLWKVVNQRDQLVVRAIAEIVWRRTSVDEASDSPEEATSAADSQQSEPEPVYL